MRISDWSSDVCSSDLETGKDHADAENLWLVDPIDGTKAFVRGYPIFSVQIALMQRGELVFGLSCAPCWNEGLGEVVWAEKRSEEHTSELQSLMRTSYAVFCLKKKITNNISINYDI